MKVKRKGESFAEKIYKHYRDMFSNYNFIFVKETMGSGATDEPADIHIQLPLYRLVIECKHWKKISLNELNKFYQKLSSNSNLKVNDIPLILYKENYQKPKVYISLADLIYLSYNNSNYNTFSFPIIILQKHFDEILKRYVEVTR